MQVPRSKRVAPHPISGLARVNLTFRWELCTTSWNVSTSLGQRLMLIVMQTQTQAHLVSPGS